MKVIFCGGGTAGHVYSVIAMAEIITEHDPGAEFLFIGRNGGEENNALTQDGYNIKTVDIYGIKRSLSPDNIRRILKAIEATQKSLEIIDDFSPDIIIATGGYVSWPVLRAGMKRGIPTLIHESNAYPGLVTRLLANRADAVMLGFEDARRYLSSKAQIETVGNPVRRNFKKTSKTRARAALGISKDDFLIISFGGSMGAKKLNDTIIEFISRNYNSDLSFTHIHATGRRYFKDYKELYPHLCRPHGSRIVPYIENMPLWMCAADMAITRSGAITLAEITSVGLPSILIPSPNVSGNHQHKNAKSLADVGAAILLSEEDLTVENLTSAVLKLKNQRSEYSKIRSALKKIKNFSVDEKIFDTVMKALKSHTHH